MYDYKKDIISYTKEIIEINNNIFINEIKNLNDCNYCIVENAPIYILKERKNPNNNNDDFYIFY